MERGSAELPDAAVIHMLTLLTDPSTIAPAIYRIP